MMRTLVPGICVIPGSTAVGVITGALKEAYLVDSGGCRDDGMRISGELDSAGITLTAIINTHSHADHCGGNAVLAEKTGCGIWAPFLEKGSMENGQLQPAVAWGGRPIPECETKYTVAEYTPVTRVISEHDRIAVSGGTVITFVPLPGHYFGQTGVFCTTAEGKRVLFAGDAVFGREKIGKYSIPFLYDVDEFKRSLDTLCSIQADWYVPSHGDPVERIDETAELNKIAVLETETCIVNLLREQPCTAEELLTRVADYNTIPLGPAQYVLIGSTIRSYLSSLYRNKRIYWTITANRMIWSAAVTH